MFLNKRKKITEQIKQSFGNIKEEKFYFQNIERYYRNKKIIGDSKTISDETALDLDFDDLFMYLDRTTSKVGQQYLYYLLRNIHADQSKKAIKEQLIHKFINDESFRLKVQLTLNELSEHECLYLPSLFQEKYLSPPKWFFILKFLALLPIVFLLLVPVSQYFSLFLLAALSINFGIHYWNKSNLLQYIGALPYVNILFKVARNLSKEDDLLLLDATIGAAIKNAEKVKGGITFFKTNSGMENEFTSLGWALFELVKIPFLLEPLVLFRTLNKLDKRRSDMDKVYSFIGKIDVLISIASLRKGLANYCEPKIAAEKKNLDFTALYHPLIEDCVSNSLNIKCKSVLLTGSNMSGKTSFIRTIGVNIITAFALNTCFAENFLVSKTDIMSAIRISDDLLNEKSYYFEEVLRIKAMLDRAEESESCLFMLDEIFKGTNTIERIAAGKAVLSALSAKNHIVFVSTHDIELADLLKEEYALYHFSEEIKDRSVGFDYKLKKGKLTKRNAIKILSINKYPKIVTEEALRVADELSNTNK
ncbi:DNA mismatch repair protein MutS [Marivirga lumbricoides]|uniref:DNA mismatch repair protein MutS n=1 Tax=Marivirga lumbricoides TaxID=1046115 RepID=A0ABQ1LCS4_9BACT|nr:DNA mismatch repair protein MutS [Marivirga lumbricoides]